MSLLNSILSSINGSQAATSNPSISRPNPSARKQNGVVPATRPQAISANIAPKRKAEDTGRDVKPKLARVETNTSLAPPPSRSTTSSPAQRQGAPLPRSQMPYRGTAGVSAAKPMPGSGTSSKPAASTLITPSTAPAAVAKTVYLAILERAKTAQAAAKEIGQIKHKPVEKLTKKDRLRMQAEAAAAAKGKKPVAKAGSQVLKGRSKSADTVDPKTGAALKEKRKPVDVGYKGTMRAVPSAPSYSGTMRGPSAVSRKPAPPTSREASYRYADYSDEEEEDEEEEEENYDSESDMEAGMDEVDLEEEQSARLAKKEDAEALRLENQLKKEKAEKKRKLEQMAAAAGAKKKRY